jgi:NAD-dependent SIR2 family protein deacetylase
MLAALAAAFAAIEQALALINKISPSYTQKKKQEFLDLQQRLTQEQAKDYPDRDDNFICGLEDELKNFFETFKAEIMSNATQ